VEIIMGLNIEESIWFDVSENYHEEEENYDYNLSCKYTEDDYNDDYNLSCKNN